MWTGLVGCAGHCASRRRLTIHRHVVAPHPLRAIRRRGDDQRLLIFGEQRVFPAAILEPRLLLSSIIPEPLRALLPIDLRRTLISIATRSRVLPSPENWSSVPSNRLTSGPSAPWYSRRKSSTSSGSAVSLKAVEPRRSQNTTTISPG